MSRPPKSHVPIADLQVTLSEISGRAATAEPYLAGNVAAGTWRFAGGVAVDWLGRAVAARETNRRLSSRPGRHGLRQGFH